MVLFDCLSVSWARFHLSNRVRVLGILFKLHSLVPYPSIEEYNWAVCQRYNRCLDFSKPAFLYKSEKDSASPPSDDSLIMIRLIFSTKWYWYGVSKPNEVIVLTLIRVMNFLRSNSLSIRIWALSLSLSYFLSLHIRQK